MSIINVWARKYQYNSRGPVIRDTLPGEYGYKATRNDSTQLRAYIQVPYNPRYDQLLGDYDYKVTSNRLSLSSAVLSWDHLCIGLLDK